MSDGEPAAAGVPVRVEPLERAILEGVDDPRCPLDVALIPLFSDERPMTGLAAFLDWRSSGTLSAMLRSRWWSGGVGECLLLPARPTLPVARIVLFGLGPSDAFDLRRAEHAAVAMVNVAKQLSPRGVMLAMPGMGQERVIVEAVFAAALAALRGPDAVQATVVAEAEASGGDDPGAEPRSTATKPEGDANEPTPASECAWWAVADPRHVARLRRVLEGPPRAARPS